MVRGIMKKHILKAVGAAALCLTAALGVPMVSQAAGWQQQEGKWYYIREDGVLQTGWTDVDGRYYFFKADGTMAEGVMKDGDTVYTFSPEGTSVPAGSMVTAKRAKNTGGGAFTAGFYGRERQELADNLNELKEDAFDGDEDEDYYEDEKVDYDKDASFEISGRLTEIAEHRLAMARAKGYGSGSIPDEGTLTDYLKAIQYGGGRRSMEVYLKDCVDADDAENKLLRSHGADAKKRNERAVYYKEMGIAHENVNGKNYYMVVFMR